MRRAALLIAVVVLLAMTDQPKRVEILRYTRYAWDDEAVTIVVRVARDGKNRSLRIAALDDGDIVRSSYIQLDGEAARQTYWIEWKSLPAGELSVVAEVTGSDGKSVGRVVVPMTVVSRF